MFSRGLTNSRLYTNYVGIFFLFIRYVVFFPCYNEIPTFDVYPMLTMDDIDDDNDNDDDNDDDDNDVDDGRLL